MDYGRRDRESTGNSAANYRQTQGYVSLNEKLETRLNKAKFVRDLHCTAKK
jgi:hypothetical protein